MGKRILTVIFLMQLALPAAHPKDIKGKITDGTGTPLPSAAVVLSEDRTVYAIADNEGDYLLELPENISSGTLVFKMAGFLSKEVDLSEAFSGRLDVSMEEDLMNLETVVVTGTRTPRLLKNTPILTRVIMKEDIERVDALNIGDLLEAEIPGIEFSYAMDQQVTLNMQGFGGNSVLFLIDGERLAGETLDNIDYNRLNLDNVERVEIIKGAASSLYGSNAVGGVVNIISKGATEPWSVNLNARYGAHNEQRYGGSAGFNINNRLNSLTSVQYTSIDSYDMRNDGDYTTFYGGYNYSIKERLEYEPVKGLRLIGRAGYFFRERNMQEDARDRYRDFSGGLKGMWDICSMNYI